MPAPGGDSVRVALSDIVFVRIPGGSLARLKEFRWSRCALRWLDTIFELRLREVAAVQRLRRHSDFYSVAEWTNLQRWLDRASHRDNVGTPRLLDRSRDAREDFEGLAALRRQLAEHLRALEDRLSREAEQIESRALNLARDPFLAPILGYAGRDLNASLRAGVPARSKDRRNLARSVCAHIARSVYKSAPLGLAAGTGILTRIESLDTGLRVDDDVYVTMQLNQELCNRLITYFRPLDAYLADGGTLHLSASARVDGDRLLWWRSERTTEGVRESLAAVPLVGSARSAVADPARAENATVRRLVETGILARNDLVSPTTADPWPNLETAVSQAAGCSHAQDYQQVHNLAFPFRTPQPLGSRNASTFRHATDAIQRLGATVVGTQRDPSSALSLDTYRLVEGGIRGDHLSQITEAIRQYLLVAGLAYSRSPSCRNRRQLVQRFRAVYGDHNPVRVEDVLVREWDCIDELLSFLLSPSNPPVHPENDLVFPEPVGAPDAYTAFYQRLEHVAGSDTSTVRLEPVDDVAPVLSRAQPDIDVVCRLGRAGDDQLDVVVESATMPDRLTARHETTLARLHHTVSVSRLRPPPRPREGRTRVTVIASPAHPQLQNLSRVKWDGEPVLALSEPVAPEMASSMIRYGDLYVRYEPAAGEFVITHGPGDAPLEFHWPSPLSPAFSRRLHFLRYLTLTGSPVVAAPRWLPHEARTGGYLPRVHLGPLVLSPRRWSVPLPSFGETLTAPSRPRAYASLRALQRHHGIPDDVFAYSATDTRPAFVDLAAPWGAETLIRLVRRARSQGAGVALLEECYPRPDQGIAGPNLASTSFVFRAHTRLEGVVEEAAPC